MKRSIIKTSMALTLGLGLALTWLWLLSGGSRPASAAPACRPLRAPGDVISVCLSGGCDYSTIQGAVDAAPAAVTKSALPRGSTPVSRPGPG